MRKHCISTRIAKVKYWSQSVASRTPLVRFWKRSFIFLLLQWQNTIYTWWLKITHIYYLTVLNARSLKLLARPCYFLEDLGENPFHFLCWENQFLVAYDWVHHSTVALSWGLFSVSWSCSYSWPCGPFAPLQIHQQ